MRTKIWDKFDRDSGSGYYSPYKFPDWDGIFDVEDDREKRDRELLEAIKEATKRLNKGRKEIKPIKQAATSKPQPKKKEQKSVPAILVIPVLIVPEVDLD